MPHGGYHGVVKMGGKTVQQGSSSDGQGGQQGGGVYNPGGYDTEIDTGSSNVGSSAPPMGSGPHSDGILSVKPTEGELAKETKPLDADSIKEGYIAGLNTFIPRKPNTTFFNDPAISVVNPEFVPLASDNPYFYSDKNYGKFAADAFTEGIASQLYNLYGDLGGRYNQFQKKGDFGVENIIELDPMLPFKPKPSQGFELFGQNINLPEMPLFGKPIKELSQSDLEKILDEVKKYEDGKPNYFEGIPGGFNIAKGMLDSISQGEERSGEFGGIKGSPTLEGLEKFIRTLDKDSNMLDSFKQADPAAYLGAFGLPQTSAGLDFFANMGLTGDKTTDAMIVEARERLAAARESQDRASGIPSLYAGPITPSDPNAIFNKPATKYPEGYGAFLLNPPAPVRPGSPTQPGFPDKDGDGVDDRYQAGPGIPRPGIESVGSLKPIKTNLPVTFDYASMAPQFQGPQYTNLGVSPAFLEKLRRFYG